MEINIGQVNSTVRATDSASLLSPEVMERIVHAVLERVRQEEGHRERSEAERRLSPGVAHEEK